MPLRWRQDLETGNPLVDNQHRELFARINGLFEACRTGQGAEQIHSMMEFLQQYVVKHFEAEERLMHAAGYPLLPMHKMQHEGFLGEFSVLKDDAGRGVGLLLTLQANRLLTDWWINHISGSDQEFARYAKSKGSPTFAERPPLR